MSVINEFRKDELKVRVFETRLEMGKDAATDVSNTIQNLLKNQELVNIIFASAPSQNEFLTSLAAESGIDWNRINAFHMDEYVGLSEDAPQRFSHFLKESIFDKVPFKEVYYMNGSKGDTTAECRRYASLLETHTPDIVCMGIGENAHVAFNDPHVADFNDPFLVKEVTLDDVSRQQQVNDGCFERFDLVPESAITLTVPALLRAKNIFCIVPGSNKAQAVFHTLNSAVSEDIPSTSLRQHENAILYLDKDSASNVEKV